MAQRIEWLTDQLIVTARADPSPIPELTYSLFIKILPPIPFLDTPYRTVPRSHRDSSQKTT